MTRLIRMLAVAAVLAAGGPALAAGGGDLDSSGINVFDRASLQRGAALFVNYCMGCHSVQYQRYQRLAEDLELSEEMVEEFLVKGNRELTDYMKSSMPYEESADWFGKAPPDLSLTARSRGPDWIYTFLRSYYMTDTGWNNTVLENPAMPHVLWDLQGIQRALTETVTDADGNSRTRITSLELDSAGKLAPNEYDRVVRDITAFMEYVAEPVILKRERIGVWVLLFLAVFTFLAYLLYVDYWKDVKK
ncbi:MAG: cytochrome c1 [Wenzhouxiangella sp.]|nr:cytochrome c1 [Wenzhouxiangella sp.]